MRRRHPLPRLWLMTDERQGDGLFGAIERLPRGCGIVFRHYGLNPDERRNLFRQVRAYARRRGHLVLLAGTARLARRWGADGSHERGRGDGVLIRSAPVHNMAERMHAQRTKADLLFVSPVFTTRSHPGKKALGPLRFGLLVSDAQAPVIALGGMSRARARRLKGFNIHGWAAIDAWTEA
jgi:thiamine-phosphate pyrophosphorylase